ncbi:ATP-binding cassette domain-containing protein [Eubacteriaceae bacterium ES2]|nr:ATP-binding cassette domain-containing protein [Eubacteriaceae bacterium ES2]
MELIINNLYKKYNKEILQNISINVSGVESIGIIGKSGCGKSTLLRMLTGLENPDGGEISMNGLLIIKANIEAYQKKIGMIFQQHNLFPHISILENITLILEKTRAYKPQDAMTVATGLLERFHLHDEMQKRPHEISGGQAQRAAIARALSTKPKLIFMDEPTAALDPILTKEVLDSVNDLKATGIEFIFVTHELSFVREFADYILFMDEGKIIEHGPVKILNNPQSQELINFLNHER